MNVQLTRNLVVGSGAPGNAYYTKEVSMAGADGISVTIAAASLGSPGTVSFYVQISDELENWGFFANGTSQPGAPTTSLFDLTANLPPVKTLQVGPSSALPSPYGAPIASQYVRIAVVSSIAAVVSINLNTKSA